MRPVEKVLEVVDHFEERHNGFWCVCPGHPDRVPSLHLEEGEDGQALLLCRAGCDQERVLDALEERGVARHELFAGGGSVSHIRNGRSKSAEKARNGHERLAASWSIKDASGRLVAIHERWEGASGKRFLWKHPNGRYSRSGRSRRVLSRSTERSTSRTGRTVRQRCSGRARRRETRSRRRICPR